MSEILGIFFAICAGIAINLGTVLQKKAVNDLSPEMKSKDYFKILLHTKLWLIGLAVQIGIGTTFTIVAQIYIGPAILPGLLATGLIAMAIGAAKIVGEKLMKDEIIAIGLIIVAIVLIALTGLTVDITVVDLNNGGFIARQYLFTGVFVGIIIFCEITQRKSVQYRSILFAIESGCFLALANYWVSPVTGHVMHLFNGNLQLPGELIWAILAIIILVLANIFAISTLQNSFKAGKANVCIPIQQVPVNIAPIFVYFVIFLKTAPTSYSVYLMVGAIALIIYSSYVLSKRQVQLDKIK